MAGATEQGRHKLHGFERQAQRRAINIEMDLPDDLALSDVVDRIRELGIFFLASAATHAKVSAGRLPQSTKFVDEMPL